MKRILVVDNNVLMLEFMREFLEGEDYRVQTASGGLEALEQLPNYRPDIVFVDLVMPEIDGKRLCRLLRAHEASRSSYIIVLSAIAAEDRDLEVTAYADAYVAKAPFKLLKRNLLALLADFEAGNTKSYADTVVGIDDIHTREITRELLHSRTHMDTVFSCMSDAFFEITADSYTVIFANPVACAYAGLREEQLISLSFPELFAADTREQVIEALASLKNSACTLGEEDDIQLGSRYLKLKCSHIAYDHYSSILVLMEDVSERKHSEQLLRSSLRQKELLLQELHHRVKNNFQIISSILHLQLNSAENEAIQQMLRISQNRIDAMSLIHENFYQSENLTRIPMQGYLQDLHIQLVSIYGQSEVESHIDAGELELGLATAIPVGLIVNELITNSLLHAEAQGQKLTLQVTLQREEEATLQLSVEDNGPGFPQDFALETTESLGILIVHNLAHQLNGEVFFENRAGAHTAVRFPLPREELGEGAGDGREG